MPDCMICGGPVQTNEDKMEYVLYKGDVREIVAVNHASCEGF